MMPWCARPCMHKHMFRGQCTARVQSHDTLVPGAPSPLCCAISVAEAAQCVRSRHACGLLPNHSPGQLAL